MGTMLAAVLVKPRRFDLQQVDIPAVGRDEVLICVTRTGICGTDVHIFNGHYAADRLPLTPGHEFCGTVAVVGKDVRHLTEGQAVVADINIGCGTCYWCRRNEILNCPSMTQIGIGRDGAFAEYVVVPARLVIPIPDGMPPELQALVEPVACVIRAARKARVGFGQSAVVLGAGPIGNLHVQMLRLCGVAPIIVADLSADRCRMALAVGADAAISDPAALKAEVLARTGGRGADLVIESVGSRRLYAVAFDLIRKGGHVAFFGITGPGETVPMDILRTVLEENSLKGSVAGMGEDMHDALTLLAHGRFQTKAFTGASFRLEDIQTAFDTLADRPADLKTQVVIGQGAGLTL
jgi:threonine dehydrogenase-like Zn-dependent dehydrogenase